MLLSKACEYAIKACIYTASTRPKGRKAGAKEISEKIQAPAPFTAKILKQLGHNHILSSTKGPKGGFYMTDEQAGKSLYEIIVIIDGDRLFTGCALGLSECSETEPCPLHAEYGPLRDELNSVMRNNTISGMAKSYGSGQAFLASLSHLKGKKNQK